MNKDSKETLASSYNSLLVDDNATVFLIHGEKHPFHDVLRVMERLFEPTISLDDYYLEFGNEQFTKIHDA